MLSKLFNSSSSRRNSTFFLSSLYHGIKFCARLGKNDRKNKVKPTSRFTCFTVVGTFIGFRNFQFFSFSGLSPFDVIELPRKFIEGIPNSHLGGVNLNPDFLRQSKICLNVGTSCSNVSTPHPISFINCVHKFAARQESR